MDTELYIKSPPEKIKKQDDNKWRPTHISQVIITLLFVLLSAFAVWAPYAIKENKSTMIVKTFSENGKQYNIRFSLDKNFDQDYVIKIILDEIKKEHEISK